MISPSGLFLTTIKPFFWSVCLNLLLFKLAGEKNFGKKGHLKKTLIYFPVVVLPGTSFEFPCKYLLKVVIKVLFLMSA